MSRDLRRTGGAANYEWQTGTHVEPVVDLDELRAQVLRYLADCRRHRKKLRASDHPKLESCLQAVFCQTAAHKEAVTELYHQETRTPRKSPAAAEDGAS